MVAEKGGTGKNKTVVATSKESRYTSSKKRISMKGRLREPTADRCCPTAMFYDLPKKPATVLIDDTIKTVIYEGEIDGKPSGFVPVPFPISHHTD